MSEGQRPPEGPLRFDYQGLANMMDGRHPEVLSSIAKRRWKVWDIADHPKREYIFPPKVAVYFMGRSSGSEVVPMSFYLCDSAQGNAFSLSQNLSQQELQHAALWPYQNTFHSTQFYAHLATLNPFAHTPDEDIVPSERGWVVESIEYAGKSFTSIYNAIFGMQNLPPLTEAQKEEEKKNEAKNPNPYRTPEE